MSDLAQVKGQRFNRIVQVTRDLSRPDLFTKFVSALPSETARLLTETPPATEWIPAQHLDDVLRISLRVIHDNALEPLFEQGRQSFIRDVRSIYRIFIKFLSPEHVISRAGQIFSTYYRNNGGLHIVSQGRREVVARYEGVAIGALEATGQRDIRAQIVDGGGEAKFCVIRVFWT